MGLCLIALKAAYSGTLVASLTGKQKVIQCTQKDRYAALWWREEFKTGYLPKILGIGDG